MVYSIYLLFHLQFLRNVIITKTKVNAMGATSGAGTAYPSGAPEITPGFQWVRVARSLVLCVIFFVWPLCYLFFFDLRILIVPLVSLNSSST